MVGSAEDGDHRESGVPAIAARFVERGVNPFVVFDDDGGVVWISRATTAVLGWTIDEARGRHFLDFIHPDYHADAFESFAAMLEGDEDQLGWSGPRLLVEVFTNDGSTVAVEITANLAIELFDESELADAGGAMICQMGVARGLPPLFRAVEQLAFGSDIELVLRDLAASAAHETPHAFIEIAWDLADGGFRSAIATYPWPDTQPTLMQQRYVGPTPWAEAMAERRLAGDKSPELAALLKTKTASAAIKAIAANQASLRRIGLFIVLVPVVQSGHGIAALG